MKNKEKCILVTGDFMESQYLWLIPILDGFLQKQNTYTIIFEKKLSKNLMRDACIKKFIKKYNIVFLNQSKFIRRIKLVLLVITNLKDILNKIIFFDNLISAKKKNLV